MSTRSVYRDPRRKLVLAFDVGTTYSGISYSILSPDQVPEIKGVTRFPAHEHVTGSSRFKIPTVIYYDLNGNVKAVGAEAMKESIYEIAEDEHWVKAEWFKLHFRSKVGTDRVAGAVPPLPLNMTAVEVFADFLSYLLECASCYIQDTHVNGSDLWNSVKSNIDFVLSHPNGLEGTQQSEMRQAAVLAGLIPDNMNGHDRLSFVTEGEAILHFFVQNGLPAEAMKNGDSIVIVDAGRGTINISSYKRNPNSPKESFEEISTPQCHYYGSVFVSIRARLFLESFLANSKFLDDLDHIVRCFDKTTKLQFRRADEPQYVKFGSTRDNDESCNIRFGQLKLMGSDVSQFFQPSVDCIVKGVLEQQETAHKTISHVVLVGEFAENYWLYTKVHDALTLLGLDVFRPKNQLNKAVSDGAISFYLDHLVSGSTTRSASGANITSNMFSSNPLFTGGSYYYIRGGFYFSPPPGQLSPGFKILHRNISASACCDSRDRFPPPRCHPSTRKEILATIMDHITQTPSSFKILYLFGSEGTGKSAIAQTIAESYGTLGACFFFSRASHERNTDKNLIATLAYQLCVNIPGLRRFIVKAVEDDLSTFQKGVNTQMERLIINPMVQANNEGVIQGGPILIIIDGIDECEGMAEQRVFLRSISGAMGQHGLPLYFFITSRPEMHIVNWLNQDPTICSTSHRLDLDLNRAHTKRDIEVYVRSEFERIRSVHHMPKSFIWPSQASINTLVSKTNMLFRYASEIMTSIDDQNDTPQNRLEEILRGSY